MITPLMVEVCCDGRIVKLAALHLPVVIDVFRFRLLTFGFYREQLRLE